MDRDEVSLQYFNQEGIQLQGAPDVDLDVFGLRHDVAMLARLAGAPEHGFRCSLADDDQAALAC